MRTPARRGAKYFTLSIKQAARGRLTGMYVIPA
jgi:hypothetical protein